MKRMTLILLLLPLLCLNLAAEVPEALSSFYSKLRESCVKVDYRYSVKTSETRVEGEGKAFIQGNLYRLTMNGLEISSDGKDMWLVDDDAMEVMVDKVDLAAVNLLDNPILFITGLETLFDLSWSAGDFYTKSDEFGVPSCKVVMIPKKAEDVLFVDVHYVPDFSSVVGAVIYMKDGTVTDITIPSMTFQALKPVSYFSVNPKDFGSDYVITDMR